MAEPHSTNGTPTTNHHPTHRRVAQHLARALLLGSLVVTAFGWPAPTPDTQPAAVDTLTARTADRASRTQDRPSPASVTVHDGDSTTELTTRAGTVGKALSDAGVVLGPKDTIDVDSTTALEPGDTVTVTIARAVTTTTVEEQTLPHATTTVDDPAVPAGTTTVTQEGRDGLVRTVVEVTTTAGVEIERQVLAQTRVEPVDQVLTRGTKPAPTPAPGTGRAPASRPVEPGTARAIGQQLAAERGWTGDEFACLDALWTKESGWRADATNRSSGAHGIPQALPGSKMASAGSDWRTNPTTQITWGLGYISGRYGTPCTAWAHSQARNWY